MKKRIFWSICLSSFITLFLAAGFIFGILYIDSENDMKTELKNETLYISKALETVENNNLSTDTYISSVGADSKNRITLIAPDGTVIYDNFALPANMENHLSRPEIQSAIKNGTGDSTRLSDTLGEKTYYYAVKLYDGNFLRVARTTQSALGMVGNTVILIILLSGFVLIISIIIARLLTKSIINPINRLNLNDPLSNDTYEELSPLLGRMEKQGAEISEQITLLSAQQKEFDYITENMNEGLVIFSDNGAVLSANNSAKQILGNDNAHSYLELCRNIDYIESVEAALSGASSSRKMDRNGKFYQLSANPVQGKDQSYAAVLFIVDITEKEQSEKIRREFSANVSHELKTPLTSIIGCAEIMQNGIVKAKDIPHFAGQIHSEASRLLALIEDIIKLSRLDEENLKRQFEDVDLSLLCRDIISELSEKAKEAHVTLLFEGEESVISGFKPVLHEMIFNLCDNAIIYNKDNGSVVLKLEKTNGKTVLSVTDTGIGIAPEHENRIFERFYRVDKSHSKKTGGTGLGLSIVKHGAILHDAEISVKSEVGKGTTIKITFDTNLNLKQL